MLPRIRLKHVLFITFTLIASLPVLILAGWVQQSALDKEVAAVEEKHLLVAQNLTGDLTRYIIDVESSFKLVARNLMKGNDIEGVSEHLASLYLRYIRIIDTEGVIVSQVATKPKIKTKPFLADTLQILEPIMKKARVAPEKVHYSNMVRTGEDETTFYLVQALPKDLYVIGALSTTHIQQAQKKVTFGRRGHAAIVDRTGRAIAHPIPSWVKSMKDMSFLPPVEFMMQGKTGVSKFFTPAMQADMVAGYTTVPRVGWGVMIPQPFEELEERANDVQIIALTIALIGIAIAGFISWYIAGILSQPIQSVVDATQFESDENQNPMVSEVSVTHRFIPRELCELVNSFNLMRSKLNIITSKLHSKIDLANEEVKNQNIKLQKYSDELLETNEKLETEVEERRKAQEESATHSSRLRSLYNVTQLQDLTHDEKILSVLSLGREFFNAEIGRVCEIDEANGINTVKYVVAPDELDIKSGNTAELYKTFCKIPFAKEDVISISNVGKTDWKNQAYYQSSGVEAYLATVIWVAGKKYGTINFASLTPRTGPFSESDIDFIRIMSQWVGISMERRVAVERDNARSAAEAANQAKGTFLANMSHELRTPINAILGYGEILLEDCEEFGNEQMKQDLEKIQLAGTHLTKIISNILDLSRIEAGKIEINCNDIDIASLLNEVANTARPLTTKNKNKFSIQLSDNVGGMYSDATIIRQVLLNIISNAAKFTTDGLINLEAGAKNISGIEHVIFTVSDTGIGMTEDQIEIIFNEFSQASSVASSQDVGIGLGLSISKKYCALLNGYMTVTSNPGKGSRFCVTLPRTFQDNTAIQLVV